VGDTNSSRQSQLQRRKFNEWRRVGYTGAEVADTQGQHWWAGKREKCQKQTGRGERSTDFCLPLWPPARDDYFKWAELAARGLDPTLFPAIESSVSVVADGLAPSSDLLRIGGEGVVTAQAAWAFLCLLGSLAAMEEKSNASCEDAGQESAQ